MKTKVNILVNGKRRCACVQNDGSFKTSDGKIYKPEQVDDVKHFAEKP